MSSCRICGSILCSSFRTSFRVRMFPWSFSILLWRNNSDCVPSYEYGAELPLHLARFPFLCIFQHNIDVDVESYELANILPVVLQLYHNALISRFIQCVQWP